MVTGVTNSTHLIASPVKPWRESTNEERLAAGNGLLQPPFFITFDDSGHTWIAPVADQGSLCHMGVNPTEPPCVGFFNVDQKSSLKHHRKFVFLNGVS